MFSYMNNDRQPKTEQYRSLQILGELATDENLTQRDLSKRMGIAVGLVNSYIKNLIKKGFIKVTSMPPRKYAYLLTPTGFAEKTRLTFHLLQGYNRVYHEAREGLKDVFAEMDAQGVRRVVFAGTDEVAEIAYITLHETQLSLVGTVDVEKIGQKFYSQEIRPVADIAGMDFDRVVIASYWSGQRLFDEIMAAGLPESSIKTVFPL